MYTCIQILSFQHYLGSFHNCWSISGYLGSLQWSSESSGCPLVATCSCGGSTNHQGRRELLQGLHWSLDPREADGLPRLFFFDSSSRFISCLCCIIPILPRIILHIITTISSIQTRFHYQEEWRCTEKISYPEHNPDILVSQSAFLFPAFAEDTFG